MFPSPTDPFDLQRFLDAQAAIYPQARAELAAGQKRSHWMWFLFPQVQGLGASPMAQRFAIANLVEARAYLAHPVLGSRLRDCTALVLAALPRTLDDVLGFPDNLKFHSSVTLFAAAARQVPDNPADAVFREALSCFFGGKPDPATLERFV